MKSMKTHKQSYVMNYEKWTDSDGMMNIGWALILEFDEEKLKLSRFVSLLLHRVSSLIHTYNDDSLNFRFHKNRLNGIREIGYKKQDII